MVIRDQEVVEGLTVIFYPQPKHDEADNHELRLWLEELGRRGNSTSDLLGNPRVGWASSSLYENREREFGFDVYFRETQHAVMFKLRWM